MYKILFNIFLSRLIPYRDEIIRDHHCGFECSRSTTDQISCILKILQNKCEYNAGVHQLFVDFMQTYDSCIWEALYNILTEFGMPVKLVWLIKTCWNEIYCEVWIGRHLSDTFPIQNVLKQGDASLPLLFKFALEYIPLGRSKETKTIEIEWDTDAINKNIEASLVRCKEAGLEVRGEKTTYMLILCQRNTGKNHNANMTNTCIENLGEFKCLGMILTN